MNLADLDRPIVELHYEPWSLTLKLRAITARQLVELNARFAGQLDDDDPAAALDFHAHLLSLVVVDPAQPPEEWAELQQNTLLTLGAEAMRVSGINAEDTKKNLPAP